MLNCVKTSSVLVEFVAESFEDVVFLGGSVGSAAYIKVGGSVTYYHSNKKDVVGSVWLAEAALWTNWSFGKFGWKSQLHQMLAPTFHHAFNGLTEIPNQHLNMSSPSISISVSLKDGGAKVN